MGRSEKSFEDKFWSIVGVVVGRMTMKRDNRGKSAIQAELAKLKQQHHRANTSLFWWLMDDPGSIEIQIKKLEKRLFEVEQM